MIREILRSSSYLSICFRIKKSFYHLEQGVQGNIHYDVLLFYSDSSLAVQSMWKNREDPFSKGGPI